MADKALKIDLETWRERERERERGGGEGGREGGGGRERERNGEGLLLITTVFFLKYLGQLPAVT